uniref:IDP2420 n=1 Tax=Arundo donax TaxID=35708 RepID=A0A0A9E4U9_ARUDO
MALTASVRREGAAVGAGASGRRKEAGAPRKGEESFLVGAWEGRPWRDKEVVAMAVFIATRWRRGREISSAAE